MYGQFDTSNANYDSLQNMSANDDYALDWDSSFSREDARGANALSPLPEGDYDFTVENVERAHYGGGSKLPPCPKANLTLKIVDADGQAHTVYSNIFLCKSTEWKIAEFFESIGLVDSNGNFNMSNWDKVVGRSGRVRIKQRAYTNRDGIQKTANDVEAYLPKQADPDVIGGSEVLPF